MHWFMIVLFGGQLAFSHDFGTVKNCQFWAAGAKEARPSATIYCAIKQ